MTIDLSLFEGLEPLDSCATDAASLGILFALIEYMKPRVVVEAGTYRGHFAVGAARILRGSRVFTADIVRHETLPTLPNLVSFRGDFVQMLDAEVQEFDFAFVDSGPPPGSDPSIRLQHWRAAQARIDVGGIVVCHDTNALDWHGAEEIIESGVRLVGGRGLTIWQRKA